MGPLTRYTIDRLVLVNGTQQRKTKPTDGRLLRPPSQMATARGQSPKRYKNTAPKEAEPYTLKGVASEKRVATAKD